MDVQVKKKTGRSMVGDKNTRWTDIYTKLIVEVRGV